MTGYSGGRASGTTRPLFTPAMLSALLVMPLTVFCLPGAQAIDTEAPGGWAGLDPANWYTIHQSPTVFVSVQDNGSGLDVGSAEYRYSTDGGSAWGDWAHAVVTGGNGTTEVQVVDAPNVPFGQDSEALNQIVFRIADMAGNVGTSPVYAIMIDTTPPGNWTGFAPAGWYNISQSPTVTVEALDTTSGLNVSDALYRYSNDGKATWSAWMPATVTGTGGTTSVETMTAAAVPFHIDSGSLNHVQFKMKDVADNVAVSPMFSVLIDTSIPGNWSMISPSGWYNESRTPTVGISVRDIASGLDIGSAQYQYSIDAGTAWSPWVSAAASGTDGTTDEQTVTASNVPFGLDSGALNKIRFRIVDIAGNAATSADNTIKIDTLAPAGWDGFAPSGWYNLSKSPTVTVNALDSMSGLNTSSALYQFSTDGGRTWTEWASAAVTGTDGSTENQTVTAAAVPFGQDSASQNMIRFRISDMAGNMGTSGDYVIMMDTKGPGNWTLLSPSGWFNLSGTPTVTVRVSDGGSGLDIGSARYQYSTDGGATWSGWGPAAITGKDGSTENQTITIVAVPFGQDSASQNKIRFRISDLTGNVGTSDEYIIKIDTLAPDNWTLVSPSGWFNLSRNPTVTLQGIDTGSGLDITSAQYQYSTDGGATWGDWTAATVTGASGTLDLQTITGVNVPFNMDSADQNRIRFRMADVAGNLGTSADCIIKVDTTPPASAMMALPAYSKTRTLSLSYTAADNMSGLARLELWYSLNGGEYRLHPDNLTGSPVIFEAAPHGAYSFYLRGTDFAGCYEDAPAAPDANITVKTGFPEPVIKIKEGSETIESSAHISGTVEPGSTVLVNGKPVPVDAQGKFLTTVPLSDGANKITVTVTDRAGNTKTVEKTVNRNAAFPMTPVLVIALVTVVVTIALAALFVRGRGKKPGTV